MIEIQHMDLIIAFNPKKPEIFFVKHKTKNTSAYYKELTHEIHAQKHIGVYKIMYPDSWLPEFITITESDLDIQINHTKTRLG